MRLRAKDGAYGAAGEQDILPPEGDGAGVGLYDGVLYAVVGVRVLDDLGKEPRVKADPRAEAVGVGAHRAVQLERRLREVLRIVVTLLPEQGLP